ncbi:MAG TPA: SiaC family regulatory phosphoprotein [Ignavibacteria bacterium]
MITGEIHILPTDNTPEFHFRPEGIITIRGRGLFENTTEVIDHIMIWIDEYLINPAEITYVNISFEYLNSFSTTILVTILRKLTQVILQSEKLVIRWYYEEDDEDILERGEYISSTFDIPINFILTKNPDDR